MCSKEQHLALDLDVQIGAYDPTVGCAIAGQTPATQLLGTRPDANKKYKERLPLGFPQAFLEILVDCNRIL